MKRESIVACRTLLAALVSSSISFAASALTLEPLPDSTPQSTHLGAFFPHDVGVIVRDGWGQPVAGEHVTFVIDGYAAAPWASFAGFPMSVDSDQDGVSVIPFVLGINAGSGQISATTAGAQAVTFDFTVTGGLVWSLRYVSGAGQAAPVGTTYPFRWAVQALDEDHHPVPRACVEFRDTEPWNVGGAFGDTIGYLPIGDQSWPNVVARADENGVATAPAWIANYNEGRHRAIAVACRGHTNNQDYDTRALFEYTNTPAQSVH